ncbi:MULTISPECIES: DNA repair helicase XPB [unclassified Nesterenkonia]|uniref:DNA repair helicase XPB n=1 Tax=unclassified Nesterenkonia TaxID=2629769 RepID=UPI001F4C9329|nr:MULTISPECIES: DNA repair helicase XPB [unclassified Nesterenkonia]MCH8560673.1 DEAD/DEAH box helicase [Nesterenkonia sp. DZ6]MCH8562951.1 DEAD/DEAH box helicase [Nesterenkonia sp. YGD6]MCH8570781.1 DEAD/DEAH box helicase [Nesterenkonia sp. AY15]
MADGPLIVQSDKTVLLEVDHPQADAARRAVAAFADLERAPEHIHTYRITPLGLWNARAAGFDAEYVVDTLLNHSRFPVPHALLVDIAETMSRYGRLRLEKDPVHGLVLRSQEPGILSEVLHAKTLTSLLGPEIDENTVAVHGQARGELKQQLLRLGWPAEDLAGFVDGTAHPIALRQDGWTLRGYQQEAVDNFWQAGSGVVVLPCGAGKTLVGAAAMATSGTITLILVNSTVSARQWKAELLKRTSLTEEEIGEYSGAKKEVRPVTIATYQVLAARKNELFTHLELLNGHDWGLIIYDEVHLLPAPIFRMTADLQARRRLGLTATLVREDGREREVFSLIGPKRYDTPWKQMEAQGWIAPATCIEVRTDMPRSLRMEYASAADKERHRLAAGAEVKDAVVARLVARHRHRGEQVLVIGQFVEQLQRLGEQLGAPVLTGSASVAARQKQFDAFRAGDLEVLVVSKIANFSIDLPQASVAIQVSGTFGSRQEEAQRLGRLLRPGEAAEGEDPKRAHFYSVVTRDTVDMEYAARRQRFLSEQGYGYSILDAEDIV